MRPGAATPTEPKSISPTDPAARYTAASDTPAFYAYSDNYLVDLKNAVIMDVAATTAVRQVEVGAAKRMIDRTAEQFDVTPSRLVADAGYGSAEMVAWLVDEREIEPHVKLVDKSERTDETFSRSDFVYDPEANVYICPGGKERKKCHRNFSKPRDGLTKSGSFSTSPGSTTATSARSSRNAALTCPPARLRPPATRRALLQRPRPTPAHAAHERRSRCSSPT
jgi:hypothetical protein